MATTSEKAVVLSLGGRKIRAVLNDSITAQDLFRRLPYKVSLSRYEFDYCGVMGQPLAGDGADKQNGWTDGDICVAGSYFSLLFSGQNQSASHTGLIRIGRISDDLSVFDVLPEEVELIVDFP